MSNYLDPVILKYFPRQKTPGVIPYVDRNFYLDRDQLPPMVWYYMADTYSFYFFKVDGEVISPPMLDTLFRHIQSSVDRNHFPKNMKPVQREWFTHVFPHCRRDCQHSLGTNDREVYDMVREFCFSIGPFHRFEREFEKEMKLLKFIHQNPTTQNLSIAAENRRLLKLMTPQQEQEMLVEDYRAPEVFRFPMNLPPHSAEDSCPYNIYFPKAQCTGYVKNHQMTYSSTNLINDEIFRLWYDDMINTSKTENSSNQLFFF